MTTRDVAPSGARTVVELQALPEDVCVELLATLKPEGFLPGERERLVVRSDGVPLYLEELARDWGNSSTDVGPVNDDGDIPDALYEPLVARLRSAPNGVVVAGACATLGRPVDRAVLSALVDLSPDEISAALQALVAANILVTADGGEEFSFRHDLVRSVAYDVQPPGLRRLVHGRVADLLVLVGDDGGVVDWNSAASHYDEARRPLDAIRGHSEAADQARRRGALTEARSQLGQSIDLIVQLPHGPDRAAREASLRLQRGFLAMSAEGAGSAEAARDYARCLELAMTNAQGDEMFSSLISLWAYHLSRAELDRSRDVLETLRSTLDGPRATFRPANRAGYGMISWFEGDFVTAREILESAAEEVDRAGIDEKAVELWFVPNDPIVAIHTHLALARFMVGDTAGADTEMARGVTLASGLDFPQGPWSMAYGAWLRAWMLTERGEHERASEAVVELMDLSVRHGFDSWTMIGMTQQAAIDATRAVSEGCDAEVAAAHAVALAGLIGMWQAVELFLFLPYYLTVLAAALAGAGDGGSASQRLQEARALAEGTNMRFYAAETARRAAHLETDRGARVDQLRRALELARSTGARPFELRVALDLCDLDDECVSLLDEALERFAPGAASPELDVARARLASSR
jgi:hypothetical protein